MAHHRRSVDGFRNLPDVGPNFSKTFANHVGQAIQPVVDTASPPGEFEIEPTIAATRPTKTRHGVIAVHSTIPRFSLALDESS